MPFAYQAGGETIRLTLDARLVAVRFRDDRPLGAQARAARAWAACDPLSAVEIPDEDVAIMPAKLLLASPAPETEAAMAETIEALRRRPDIAPDIAKVWPVFNAGRLTVLGTNRLVIGLVHVSCASELTRRFALKIVETRDDKIVCEVSDTSDPFPLIPELEDDPAVRFVEPDLITIGSQVVEDQQPLPAADVPSAGVDRLASADGAHPSWIGHQDALTALARSLGDSRNRISRSADQSPLMAVRITPTALSRGRQKTTNTIIARSINWARRSGADIITHSWEGALPSSDISEEFERARRQGRDGLGCVMVAVPDARSGLANVLGANTDLGWACDLAGDETPLGSTTLSGACALILAANPGLTEGQVRDLVAGACDYSAAAAPRRNRPHGTGGPHIDVLDAVQSALAMAP